MCSSLAKTVGSWRGVHGTAVISLVKGVGARHKGIVCADRLQHSDDSGADLDTQRKKSSKSSSVKMKA